MKPGLTVIIPCYNSSLFITETFHKLEKFLLNNNDANIIYVDDASNDETSKILTDCINQSGLSERIRLVCHDVNRGKGGAICTGLNYVETDIVCYTDADLAYHIDNISEFRKQLEKGKLIVANRVHADSVYLIPPKFLHYIFTRHLASRIFNRLIRFLLIPGVNDVQAGLKMACTEDMLRWSQFVTKKRFSFDTELLVIASSHNIDLVGSPVRFKYDSERSTMNFVSDSVSMFADLLHIKYRKMKGYYLK